jgi:hypothetical protein
MPELQPGHADVVLEVRFDKLAPNYLRSAIATDCATRIDLLVPPATRDTWLNKTYAGGSDPADLLAHVQKVLSEANPSLSASPSPKEDFYCWVGANRRCYAPFEVKENGDPVVMTVESNGLLVNCQLMAVMAIVPGT